MTTARPYFNSSIAELEALHAAAPGDQYLSQELLKELKHRSTGRAAALLHRLAGGETPKTQTSMPPVTVALPTKREAHEPLPPASLHEPLWSTAILRTPSLTAQSNDPAAILAAWVALEALSLLTIA